MFNIVLVTPNIPQNTGAIGRICVNSDATLHLIKPLSFD
ncbi:MAG: tRNA (cytidine(34)-2'-O)-methyltransferase, partial [Sulfurospirillum sp.]